VRPEGLREVSRRSGREKEVSVVNVKRKGETGREEDGGEKDEKGRTHS
jgi:hypothetical protein